MATVLKDGIELPDGNLANYARWFLLARPNQTLDRETPLTTIEWVELSILQFIRGQVIKGKRMEDEANATPDNADDIVAV